MRISYIYRQKSTLKYRSTTLIYYHAGIFGMEHDGQLENILVKLAGAIELLQNDVKALFKLFSENVTFIKGMGDVPDQMGKVLMDIVDNHEVSTKMAMQQLVNTSEFFKQTESQIYPNMNIMQEWFSEFAKETIGIFTDRSDDYIRNWLIVKTQDESRRRGKLSNEMDYYERADYGETIFKSVVNELGADPMCHYILRTLYIPYVSVYYLRPFTDYPYYEEWKKDLERFTLLQEVRAEMENKYPDMANYRTQLIKELSTRTESGGLIYGHDH